MAKKPTVNIISLITANDVDELASWVAYKFPLGDMTLLDLEKLYEYPHGVDQKWLVKQVLAWAAGELASKGHGNLTSEERAASLKRITAAPGNNDILQVRYLAIGKQIDLPGHLMHFKDDYSPKWNAEEVYGRMDPIITYQGTPRKVTLAWEVDAPGGVAADVAGRVGDLIKFLYPVYEDSGKSHSGTGTMTAAPLLRIALITNRSEKKDEKGNVTKSNASSFLGGSTGFLIAIDSFDIEKYTAAGGQDFTVKRLPAGGILPIKYTITLGGTVFHEDAKPGWVWSNSDDGTAVSFGTKMGARYPYGQRGAIDTYRTPEQALGAANARAKAGSAAAQASNANIDGITAADPEAYQPTGGAISSTVDDAP